MQKTLRFAIAYWHTFCGTHDFPWFADIDAETRAT